MFVAQQRVEAGDQMIHSENQAIQADTGRGRTVYHLRELAAASSDLVSQVNWMVLGSTMVALLLQAGCSWSACHCGDGTALPSTYTAPAPASRSAAALGVWQWGDGRETGA